MKRGQFARSDSAGHALARRRLRVEPLEERALLSAAGFDYSGFLPPEFEVGREPLSVAAADFDDDGAVDLVTADADSRKLSILRNRGDGTFAPATAFSRQASFVTTADVDGDGLSDIVTAEDTIVVLRNLGDGTFAPIANGSPIWGSALTLADLNGDGALDLATITTTSQPERNHTLTVYWNLGDGRFTEGPAVTDTETSCTSVAAADLNGDGAPDLVTSSLGPLNDLGYSLAKVAVFWNYGGGSFARDVVYTGDTLSINSSALTPADVDGDGAVDLVAVNRSFGSEVLVLRNQQDSTFALVGRHAIEGMLSPAVAADVDRDGSVDLVAANSSTNTLVVLRNAGGSFDPAVAYAVGLDPEGVAAADVDGDGAVDFVTVNARSEVAAEGGTVSVVLNRGDGSLAAQFAPAAGSYRMAMADVDGDGAEDLITGYISARMISVSRSLGGGAFAAAEPYFVEGTLAFLTAADLDGDGAPEIVATLTWGNDGVVVLRNLGDGTFAAPVRYDTDIEPQSVAAADFNGDGALDLVTSNRHPGTASVLLNRGDGTFAEQVVYSIGSLQNKPGPVIVADMNGDGATDLVASSAGTISVHYNRGNGRFAERVAIGLETPASVHLVVDVDGDGWEDLVVNTSEGLAIAWNQGNGSYAEPVLQLSDFAAWIRVADVDGDGAADLVAASPSYSSVSGEIRVLRGLGERTFAPPITYVGGDVAPELVDLTGDGALDLVTTLSRTGSIVVLPNRGNGTFVATVVNAAAPYLMDSAVADFNADGAADLVVVHLDAANNLAGSVSVMVNRGGGTLEERPLGTVGLAPRALAIADFNGDGALDVATANWGSRLNGYAGTVSILQNLGDGTTAQAVDYAVGREPQSLAAADLNADGALDLVVTDWDADYITARFTLLLNQGDGTFADGGVVPVAEHTEWTVEAAGVGQSLAAADFDGDGNVDLAATDVSGAVLVVRNTGGGALAEPVAYAVGKIPADLTATDVDGDGAVDLIAVNRDSNTVSVLRNRGDGTFAPSADYPAGARPSRLVAADLDGDGDADLVVGDSGSANISVLENLGDGTFAHQRNYGAYERLALAGAADFDGDGAVDLAVYSRDSDAILVLPNLVAGSELADLQVAEVSAASPEVIGAALHVEYVVENRGPLAADGDWVDAIFLSRDGQFDSADHLLTHVVHQGGLAPGASYRETLDMPLPPFPGFVSGNWFVLVRTDARGDAPERDNANNTGASASLALRAEVPQITSVRPELAGRMAGTARLLGTFTDGDAPDQHTVRIDWGDGTGMEEATVAESDRQGSFLGLHAYSEPGAYLVTVVVADAYGAETSASLLFVNGTFGADTVAVGVEDSSVTVAASFLAQPRSFALADVPQIVVRLWDGDDVLTADAGLEIPIVADGGWGDDLLQGGAGDDQLYGSVGNDRLEGGGGINWLRGNAGSDVLVGGPERDYLYGSTGDDRLEGGGGVDRLFGQGGEDVLLGGDGNDALYGGPGYDELYGGPNNDRLYGHDGNDDLIDLEGNYNFLKGDAGNDFLLGGERQDDLSGGAGDDVVLGGGGDDLLAGNAGRDLLVGGKGSDTLLGFSDDDLLIGGTTAYDENTPENRAALHALLARWAWIEDAYSLRVETVRTGRGLSVAGVRLEAGVTVLNDAAVDVLAGSAGHDWFFADQSGDDADQLSDHWLGQEELDLLD